MIESLWVRDFRCIADAWINCSAEEVWLVGTNASGKTSLLEAIYVLLRGHSFLSVRHGPLVRTGAAGASIGCRMQSGSRKPAKLSCQIKGRACHAQINGTEISYQSLVEQSGLVRFFGANAQDLISGEPRIRRSYVDWNLCYVEPSYRGLITKYSRLLQQRNSALKTHAQPVAIWDAGLAELAEKIGAHRESYLTELSVEINSIGGRILADKSPTLTWSHGWPKEFGMEGALRRNADSDRKRGFTQCGAHRFTASLSTGPTQTSGSRGEQKLLAAILQMACERLSFRASGRASIWLVDDPFSELTHQNAELLVGEIRTFDAQLFITGMTEPTDQFTQRSAGYRMFHVEHGVFHDIFRQH